MTLTRQPSPEDYASTDLPSLRPCSAKSSLKSAFSSACEYRRPPDPHKTANSCYEVCAGWYLCTCATRLHFAPVPTKVHMRGFAVRYGYRRRPTTMHRARTVRISTSAELSWRKTSAEAHGDVESCRLQAVRSNPNDLNFLHQQHRRLAQVRRIFCRPCAGNQGLDAFLPSAEQLPLSLPEPNCHILMTSCTTAQLSAICGENTQTLPPAALALGGLQSYGHAELFSSTVREAIEKQSCQWTQKLTFPQIY